MAFQLGRLLLVALIQLLDFGFALSQALLDLADLFGLIVQLAARTLVFEAQIGELFASFGEVGISAIALFLERGLFGFPFHYLGREVLVIGGGGVQVESGLGGLALP